MLPGPGDFRQPTEISFSGWKHCEEIDCFLMAVVAHVILLVGHRLFAFTRCMAVASALALALILGHLVPLAILGTAPIVFCLAKRHAY